MMKICDLFCCAGGASMGLHRAFPGAEIVGVDIKAQPHYPFKFIQADALTFPLEGFDFVWASPPCQGYCNFNSLNKKEHPLLIDNIRKRLQLTNALWVIENVGGAKRHLKNPIRLCGSMFGLRVRRHRYFESNIFMMQPACDHSIKGGIAVYGDHPEDCYVHRRNGIKTTHFRRAASIDVASLAMDIDWMDWNEIREAIPPAYSEWIGNQLKSVTGIVK